MPCSEKVAQQLVQRLKAHKFSDRSPEDRSGVREIIGKTLMLHAKSNEHAKTVIDHIFEFDHEFPTPAYLISLCESTSEPDASIKPPNENCTDCHGSGWSRVAIRRGEEIIGAVRRCECTKKN